MISETRY